MRGLTIIDEKATAIDVGSERLHVSIGGGTPRVFGTKTCDVSELVHTLTQEGVGSVAMEATGVYWMYLYTALQAAGMEVLVVNARHVRNLPGRKTDMSDSQWLATLHAHGLLRSGFVPGPAIRCLQDYVRLRDDHLSLTTAQVQKMQQALERMNIKFHDAISELSGVSGMKVLRAILDGERDPHKLLELCDVQIRRNKAKQVVESLRGIWREEHLFQLRQAVQIWDFVQAQIAECDGQIAKALHEIKPVDDDDSAGPSNPGKRVRGNTPKIKGLHKILVQACNGQDPTKLPGMADLSLLKLISEVGCDMTKWPTEKHFTAWAGLAPGTAQSGKRRKNQSRQCNRAGRIFCDMARSAGQALDSGLAGAYRRLKARRGGLVATKALARKLAVLFWRTMVHGVDYVEQGLKKYQERAAHTEQRVLKKLARKHGMQLTPVAAAPV